MVKSEEPEVRVIKNPEHKPKDPNMKNAVRKSTPVQRMTIQQAMEQTGTSTPSEALKKLNEGRHGRGRMIYMPHTGSKQKAKALKRAAMKSESEQV